MHVYFSSLVSRLGLGLGLGKTNSPRVLLIYIFIVLLIEVGKTSKLSRRLLRSYDILPMYEDRCIICLTLRSCGKLMVNLSASVAISFKISGKLFGASFFTSPTWMNEINHWSTSPINYTIDALVELNSACVPVCVFRSHLFVTSLQSLRVEVDRYTLDPTGVTQE